MFRDPSPGRQFLSRRAFLSTLTAGGLFLPGLRGQTAESVPHRVPVIDCTDLYHPHQDVGDNFDLVAAYGLPEIDLRAVILDTTDRYRQAKAHHPDPAYRDPNGPRDPGFIPVLQLNYLFNRDVPCAVGPFQAMRSPEDRMLDLPRFQQLGVELLLRTLRQSTVPVDLLSFGSARPLAVAFNRDPELLRKKVRRIHLSAGTSSPDYLEWNVMLDQKAIVRLLRSDLPIAVYPCATSKGPFAYGPNNSYWKLPSLQFIQRMDPGLKNYLAFAFSRSNRMDFLHLLDESPSEPILREVYSRPHNVWETAVWAQVAGRKIVRPADGEYRLVEAPKVLSTDKVLPNDLRPCRLDVRDDGRFRFQWSDRPTTTWMYDRGDPQENERALRQALPALYVGFKTDRESSTP